jgi:hypothetical protein
LLIGTSRIIYKEILSGRVASPFENSPFLTLQISPLEKPGEFRVIHHLSYPDGTSINDGISKDLCTVQYQTIGDASKVKKGEFSKGDATRPDSISL